ncbi:hypothetical protein E2562_023406 [Oryza meyeriana var. granulata]|uniref:DEUBAD domain-containing protein n=1 Tax=Oryza meyeriana var. granulata TaxID=110450 RepID=A0A6G1DZN3_9ORYZ|nr:hypothetical protein E2562_023406 [Oryza meyeriana var. granulata]
MTCRMAAGKQKKRIISSTNSDQHRTGKKSKVQSSNCLISLKSQISLKWDDYQKRVVPKKEQVGILWSDLAPFIDSRQKHYSGLADVTYIPPEAFSLENLRSVLSYEVWDTCLTEAERKFLIQFLPTETDAEENVYLLLTGQNHHFGNPSLSWSSSLCYGNIHPDAVLNKEKKIRADEKEYRINLNNYHSNMVESVKKWKKRWLSSDDPEIMFRDNLAKHKQGDTRPKGTSSEIPLKAAQSSDVSKFMSYIEVSRTQHNLVKSMKQSGDGINTKHLTRVIGNLDKFHVKPYGTLIDNEQRRLREHWLNIACNDLPAAFEVLKDRKVTAEKLRNLLGLELGEKNVSIVRKADQLAGITKELGQHGACEIDSSTDLQNALVEHCDDDETKHIETSVDHHDRLYMNNRYLTVDNGTDISSQSAEDSDLQDQDHKDTSCVDTSISFCASNLEEQNEDLMDMKFSNDGPDVQAEDIKEINYTETIMDHSPESQQIKTTCYTTTPIDTLESQNTQAQNLEGITYTGPSNHAHEQDQGLKSTSYKILIDKGHGVRDITLANSYPEMNGVTMDLKEVENTTVMPSNSSALLSKTSGEQIPVEELHLNDQAAKGGKDVWELTEPHDSYYLPLENNSMYNDSGGLQIGHRHLPAGQQGSVICMENGILSQQQSQVTIASAFPMDNPASFIQPCSNRQSNGQVQTIGNDIGILPYSLEHTDCIGQSTDLHSLVNNQFSQSTQFPSPLQEQRLIDQTNSVLYDQLHKNSYSDVSFETKGNNSIIEQHSFAACGSMDQRYNCFPQEHQPHDNWPAMESNNCLPQALPVGSSNTDGSLFSALAQYRQPSSLHMHSGRSSPSQLLEIRNQVLLPGNFVPRTQGTNLQVPNIYGYTQNLPSSSSSHVASVGSLNNMQWTNLIQQNPGMPNLMNRQFQGPWTR